MQRPPEGETSSDRVVAFLRRAMRAAEREPSRTSALVLAMASPDPAVRECQLQVMDLIEQTLFAAMGDIDPELKAPIAVVLRQVWHASLIEWVNDWSEASSVGRDLESAAEALTASGAAFGPSGPPGSRSSGWRQGPINGLSRDGGAVPSPVPCADATGRLDLR